MLLRACLILILTAGIVGSAVAQSDLPQTVVLARLSRVPDQMIGGEIMTAVYARLGIKVEFVDVEAARALELSSSGAIDGEIQRIDAVAQQFPSLIRIATPVNYIEPSAPGVLPSRSTAGPRSPGTASASCAASAPRSGAPRAWRMSRPRPASRT